MLGDYLTDNPWYNACGATFLISAVPIAMLGCIPVSLLKRKLLSVKVLNVLLSFAAGGLLGDVFLHALPHLLLPHDHGGHEHEHEHDHHDHKHDLGHAAVDPHRRAMNISLAVLVGFFLFFLADRVAAWHMKRREAAAVGMRKKSDGKMGSDVDISDILVDDGSFFTMASSGWLNIIADMMHNFTDGIALGVVFQSNNPTLMVATTVSVFIHEIPHELGDFAILIESGLSKSNAIATQLVTAGSAFAGTWVGFVISELVYKSYQEFMLALSCGGFVYLATVIVLSSIASGDGHSHSHGHDGKSKSKAASDCTPDNNSLAQIFWDSCGFILGVYLMVLVAELEQHEHGHGH